MQVFNQRPHAAPVVRLSPCRQLTVQWQAVHWLLVQQLAAVRQLRQQEAAQQLGRPAMALCPCCLVVVVVAGIQLVVVLRLVLGGEAV